jgi:hypothetical protein
MLGLFHVNCDQNLLRRNAAKVTLISMDYTDEWTFIIDRWNNNGDVGVTDRISLQVSP